MKYEEINLKDYNREDALQKLESKQVKDVINGLLAITFNDGDWELVQELCIQHSSSQCDDVRGIAVLCLGHISRINRKIDLAKTLPILKAVQMDKSALVRGQAENAISDIEIFLQTNLGI